MENKCHVNQSLKFLIHFHNTEFGDYFDTEFMVIMKKIIQVNELTNQRKGRR